MRAIIAIRPAMPLCWDREADWVEWLRLNEIASTKMNRSGAVEHYCADCTEKYHEEMVSKNRCGHPDWETRPEKVNYGKT